VAGGNYGLDSKLTKEISPMSLKLHCYLDRAFEWLWEFGGSWA